MLTGVVADTMAAVLRDSVDLTAVHRLNNGNQHHETGG
jgi:hypothetical protein